MGNVLGQIGSIIVWTLEFLVFWFLAMAIAPNLAWAILAFVAFFGIIGGVIGFIYGVITG